MAGLLLTGHYLSHPHPEPQVIWKNINTILWSIGTSMTHIFGIVEGQESDDLKKNQTVVSKRKEILCNL